MSSKVYKNLNNYERFYGFEKNDGVFIGVSAFVFLFLFETLLLGIVLIASYVAFCLIFKRKKPVGWLESYISYQIKPKILKAGGDSSYE